MTEELSPLTHVSRPAEAGDGPAPAVVVLHGRETNERDLLPIADELPDELHVLSVRAPDRLQGVSSSGPNARRNYRRGGRRRDFSEVSRRPRHDAAGGPRRGRVGGRATLRVPTTP